MKLLAYTDYIYHRSGGRLYAERAFALFLTGLVDHVDELTIIGRLDPEEGQSHYQLPERLRFIALPYYNDLSKVASAARSLARSVYVFWKALGDADAVWLLGPSPHAVAFACVARMSRRRLVLGVRQDYRAYIRGHRPGRRSLHLTADLLELIWRRLAGRSAVVAVGPDLARQYRYAPELLEITVSLISEADIAAGERAAGRSYSGELTILSVGRIDSEKNPLLLADVLARLREEEARWRLAVCGEGPLAADLQARLEADGLSAQAELIGYLPLHPALLERYRQSHVFLHVSLTEGLPQVLVEAFASGIPVVATAVGGVPEAAGDAAVLIPPADPGAAASAVRQVAEDPKLRGRLVQAGLARAREHAREKELARVAAFIARWTQLGSGATSRPASGSHLGRRSTR